MFLSLLLSIFGNFSFFTGMVGGRNSFLPPLSKEEEERCLIAVERGDKAAKEKLIKHNMRLVAHIVKKYSSAADPDDLISVGSIGLIKAVGTYKRGHGTGLSTYTAKCIENEILMYLRAGKKYKNDLSLTSPVGTDKEGNELSFMDLLFEKEEDVFDKTERDVMGEKFNKTIRAILKEREYEIIRLRYGLNGCIPLTQWETAKRLGISRSYVSRIEKRAIKTLRDTLRREDYLE